MLFYFLVRISLVITDQHAGAAAASSSTLRASNLSVFGLKKKPVGHEPITLSPVETWSSPHDRPIFKLYSTNITVYNLKQFFG